jgi:outer membrane receptor protein involved in Fe transport
MDNQAPGLNFSVGNIVGISDLDIESVELLPGASSALYGAGGTNGTLVMNSKSPFTYPGLSFSYKVGVNHVDCYERGASPFEDMSLRFAKAWNNKLAFKTNISYLEANDWQAQNYSNYNSATNSIKPGNRSNDPAYDGVNVYGDEPNSQFPKIGGQTVTRTGYNERDLVDYGTKSFKTSNALHYKFGRGFEAIAQANWGTGTSVYTGTARYSLRNFTVGQYKLELKGDNFFVRGYTIRENSGDTFQATALASYLNEGWKESPIWFGQYGAAYQNAIRYTSAAEAHNMARTQADIGRPEPGSAQFETIKAGLITQPIGAKPGAKFNDKSNLYHYEGMYNFTNMFNKVVEVLAGASYRVYNLNSEGTLFDDLNGGITINEYGGYVQAAKKLLQEKLKLTASARYDKSQNFDGRVTPRFSAVYTVARNNNIRASYQTGFRNPTNQDQYINLVVKANTRLIASLPAMLDAYNLRTNPGYSLTSIQAGAPKLYTFGDLKPESVQAYELGYKGLLTDRLLVDVSGYYNSYKDFISQLVVIQPGTPSAPDPLGLASGKTFVTYVNDPEKVESYGGALGVDYKVGKFNLSTNASYNALRNASTTLVTEYNTPKYRFNVGVASREIAKNIGFSTVYRWQDKYTWSSTFVTGEVPAYGTLDAQVSLKIPAYSSTIKLGSSNLLNQYYTTSYGNPEVGGMYYVSVVFDQFMR